MNTFDSLKDAVAFAVATLHAGTPAVVEMNAADLLAMLGDVEEEARA